MAPGAAQPAPATRAAALWPRTPGAQCARSRERRLEERRIHVAALGELKIDLVLAHAPGGQGCFAPRPGGPLGNVAVGVARLGGRTAMSGNLKSRAAETIVQFNAVLPEKWTVQN